MYQDGAIARVNNNSSSIIKSLIAKFNTGSGAYTVAFTPHCKLCGRDFPLILQRSTGQFRDIDQLA